MYNSFHFSKLKEVLVYSTINVSSCYVHLILYTLYRIYYNNNMIHLH